MSHDLREKFLIHLRDSVRDGSFVKLTLGKPRGAEPGLQNLYVRPVALRDGPQFSFVWRHERKDVTKNHPPADALQQLDALIGTSFHSAHLFTEKRTAQLEYNKKGEPRLTFGKAVTIDTHTEHDRAKERLLTRDSLPWLQALGVTTQTGAVREGMADKHRQIHKFVEILSHLTADADFSRSGSRQAFAGDEPKAQVAAVVRPLASGVTAAATSDSGSNKKAATSQESATTDPPLQIADMGCGKGYLTFATHDYFNLVARQPAQVLGVEARPELVEFCNRVAHETNRPRLRFSAGRIADLEIENQKSKSENHLDVLIALHACDTATDDALARGIAAGATLLVVAPCCQKELRPQLTAAPVLAPALRHGIFQERHAEFATDALRALLLEWAGYDTKVFEFISTEHTAKNTMIAATKRAAADTPALREKNAAAIRSLVSFYGIKSQSLARQLGFSF